MDLLLHIGCEKTGTTSLQYWFDHNAAALAERGIVYSRSLGRPNNRRISFYGIAAGTFDEGLAHEGVHTEAEHAAFQDRIAADLRVEVAAARAAGCTTFVISNEHCHSRVKKLELVQRVHDLLAPLFDTIRICCFVRPQIDMCLSLASTMARNGGEVSRRWIDMQMQPGILYYEFGRILRGWEAAFGRTALLVVPFRRTPDVIGWFEQYLGIESQSLPRLPASNESLDWRVIAITNALHSAMEGKARAPARRFFINELPVTERLTLDCDSAQALQARFDGSNGDLCAHWPELALTDLTPDWSRYPQVGTVDRLDTARDVGSMLARIMDRMQFEAAFDKARMYAAMAERDGLLDRLEQAQGHCSEAIAAATQAARFPPYRQRMEQLIVAQKERAHRLQRRMVAKARSANG